MNSNIVHISLIYLMLVMFITFVNCKFPKQMSIISATILSNIWALEITWTKNWIPQQYLNDFFINYFKTYDLNDLIFLLKLKRRFVEIKCSPIALPNVQWHVATVERFYHCTGRLKGTDLVTQFEALLKTTLLI